MPKAISVNIHTLLTVLDRQNATLDTQTLTKLLDKTSAQVAGIGRIAARKGWVEYWNGTYRLTAAGKILLDSKPPLYAPLTVL